MKLCSSLGKNCMFNFSFLNNTKLMIIIFYLKFGFNTVDDSFSNNSYADFPNSYRSYTVAFIENYQPPRIIRKKFLTTEALCFSKMGGRYGIFFVHCSLDNSNLLCVVLDVTRVRNHKLFSCQLFRLKKETTLRFCKNSNVI